MSDHNKKKVVVITGVGKGIGQNLFVRFIQSNYIVAGITRSQDDIDHINKMLSPNGFTYFLFKGDVTNENDSVVFIEKVFKKFSKVDILINNAGIRMRKSFDKLQMNEFMNVFNSNFFSAVHFIKLVLADMKKNHNGKIINISSIAGINGFDHLSAYVSSKSALNGLTKSLAIELAENNIQVNAIAPGFIKSSYFEDFKQKKDLYNFTINRTPMKRWGELDEISNLCIFLASDQSSYITGQIIPIDGGWTA